MDSTVIEGIWWLPESKIHQVPGTLTAESSRFRLETHGALRKFEPREPVDGVISYTVGGPSIVTNKFVHGYTRDRKQITIINATGIDMSGPFEAVKERYDIDIALIGAHIEADSFAEISVEYDWLDAWLDPPSISGSDTWPIDASPH